VVIVSKVREKMPRQSSEKRFKAVPYDDSDDVPKLVLLPVPSYVTKKRRVIIERPAPEPVRRVCAFCGAVFDDHTCQPSTVYCRPSCKRRMSELKRDQAVKVFALIIGSDDLAWSSYASDGGLPALEKRLNALGYVFSRERKGWTK
jgi:hypothetical protein